MRNVNSLDTTCPTRPDGLHYSQQQSYWQNGVSESMVPIFASKQVAAKQVRRQEANLLGQQPINAGHPAAGLAHRLHRLPEAFTRVDGQATERQHDQGKLTVQEKKALWFDTRTFVETVPGCSAKPRDFTS